MNVLQLRHIWSLFNSILWKTHEKNDINMPERRARSVTFVSRMSESLMKLWNAQNERPLQQRLRWVLKLSIPGLRPAAERIIIKVTKIIKIIWNAAFKLFNCCNARCIVSDLCSIVSISWQICSLWDFGHCSKNLICASSWCLMLILLYSIFPTK